MKGSCLYAPGLCLQPPSAKSPTAAALQHQSSGSNKCPIIYSAALTDSYTDNYFT